MASQIFNTIGVTAITDVTDASKVLGINLSGSSTETNLTLSISQTANRTLTIPDATTTMVGTDTTQIITNKTTYEPLGNGLTATGTTQGTALALTNMHNVVTTTPLNSGVRLPVALFSGLRCVIANQGANQLTVYPSIGGIIDQAGTNNPVFVPVGATAVYGSVNGSNIWYTINPVITLGQGTTVTYGNGQASVSVGNDGNLPPSNGGTGITTTPTNGQILIGNGSGFTLATLSSGSGISVANASGSITISNTGVTNIAAGTAISVSASTGAITVTNTGVTSFSAGTTGFSPAASTTGAVTLSGVLVATNGGTGQSVYTIGDLLFANTTTTLAKLPDVATGNALISGGVGVAPQYGKINLTTTVSGSLPPANGGTGITTTPTNGQLLIGNGAGFTLATVLTSGSGISVANGAGTITLSNTGVTSLTAGTAISVSATTGAITVTNTGVTSFSAGTTGFSPTSASTGAVVLSGILNAASGGTGLTSTPTNGQLLIGNGSGFTLSTISAGTAISVTNASGAITITNTGPTSIVAGTAISVSGSTGAVTVTNTGVTSLIAGTGISISASTGSITITSTSTSGVTSFSAGTTGFSPTSASTGAVVLSGTLSASSGGTGITSTPTNGQLLIGNGSGFVLSTISAGTAISVTNASGSITITNTGPTSIVAGTGISVSGSTGAVTVTNTGVTSLTAGTGVSVSASSGAITITNTGVNSFSAGTTGFSPTSATTGVVVLSGILAVTNGGTGINSPGAGSLLIGNGSSAMTQLADVAIGSALTSGGVGVAPIWTVFTNNSTASTLVSRDTSANTRLNNLIEGYATTVTAAGTTTLTVSSAKQQFFTGSTTQTVVLPVTSTLVVGQQYEFVNTSSGTVTIQTATPTTLTTVASGGKTVVTCVSVASDAIGSWNVQAAGGGGGAVTSVMGTTNQVTVAPTSGSVVVSTPSTFIAPGTIQDTTGMLLSTSSSVSAAGTTQGTATALTTSYNVVTTVGSNTGVRLQTPSVAGLLVTVVNKGANSLHVYPASGGAIDSAGTNNFVNLGVNGSVTYEASSTTQWLTVNPPVVGGTNIQVAYGNGQTLISSTATITASDAVIGPVGLNTQQPIAFISATSNGGINITSITINAPSGITRDMTMVAIITLRTTGAYGTMQTPVGWDLITTRMDNTGGPTYFRKVFFFFKTTTATEPASYTWSSISPASNWIVGGIQMFSNVAAFNIINASGTLASPTSTSLAFDVPSITTLVANTMLVGFYTYASCSVSWTTSGGMTQAFIANSQSPPQEIGEGCLGAYKTNAAIGAVGGVGVFTATASGTFPDWGFSCLIALTPIATGSIILATQGALDVGSKNSTFINFGNQNAPTNMYNLTTYSGYDTASPLTLVASAQQSATIMSCFDADMNLLSGIDNNGEVFIGGSTNNAFVTTFANAPTANRTITFPDITDTVVTLTATQTMTNKTLTESVLGPDQGTPPAAPVSGSRVYSALRAGKSTPATIGPAGYAYEIQSALYSKDIRIWRAQGNSTTVFLMNFGNTATGTATTRNIAATNYFTSTKRIGYVSTATAGNSAGTRHGIQQFWRGNATGLGGFFYLARFGISSAATVANQRSFVGLVSQTTVLSNADPSTQVNILGFGVNSADTIWTFMHNDATGAATKDTLTGTFPPRDLSVSMFEARIYCPPNGSTIFYSLEVLNGGSLFEGSTATNIPSNTTFMSPQIWTNNGATALACGIDVNFQYIETDY